GGDRLPVRQVHDEEQANDQQGDRPDIPEPGRPQDEKDGQGGLGAVGRRRQGGEPERRNPGDSADAVPCLLAVGQRPAKQPGEQRHRQPVLDVGNSTVRGGTTPSYSTFSSFSTDSNRPHGIGLVGTGAVRRSSARSRIYMVSTKVVRFPAARSLA